MGERGALQQCAKICRSRCSSAPRAVVVRRRRHEAFETRRGTSRFSGRWSLIDRTGLLPASRSNPGDPPRQCRSRARLAPCLRSRTTRRVEPNLNGDLGFPLSSRAAGSCVATPTCIAFNRVSCAKWLLVPFASLQEMRASSHVVLPVGFTCNLSSSRPTGGRAGTQDMRAQVPVAPGSRVALRAPGRT